MENISNIINPNYLDFFCNFFAIALGGSLGAYARYALTLFFIKYRIVALPFGILSANLLGSFLMGLGTSLLLSHPTAISPEASSFIFIGFLGALTTFSTFAYDTFSLWGNGERLKASLCILLNVIGGFILALTGFLIPLI